jgi:hypothetical protein
MFGLNFKTIHLFCQFVCYGSIVRLGRNFGRVETGNFICNSHCRGPRPEVLGPGYCRALSGDLDLDGATILLKGISTTNYEYEEWL